MSGGGGEKGAAAAPAGAEEAERLLTDGEATPLEIMLAAMRALHAEALATQCLKLHAQAADIATKAAPYCHPRLNSVTHKGDEDAPLAFVMIGAPEAEDAETWIARHATAPETP